MFQYVTMCYNMLQKTNHCVTKPVTASDLPALAGSFPVEALSCGKDYRCQANYAFDLYLVFCSVPLPQFLHTNFISLIMTHIRFGLTLQSFNVWICRRLSIE